MTGSLRDIQLKRNGNVISKFDLYELLLNGNTENDKRLMSGDVIFIPPVSKTVGIEGEVARPGIYELKQDETLKDLISYAGKLKPKAKINFITKDKYSFTLASSCIGKPVAMPLLSKDRKNLKAKGIIR